LAVVFSVSFAENNFVKARLQLFRVLQIIGVEYQIWSISQELFICNSPQNTTTLSTTIVITSLSMLLIQMWN